MSKVKIPGLATAKPMESNGFTLFPPGDYLLEVKSVESKEKADINGEVTGITFQIKSEIIGAENLPAGENLKDYVGKDYMDFIYVMLPSHPKYDDVTNSGSKIGEIGLSRFKSFLDAAGVVTKNDEFDEKKAIGKWIEVTMGTRKTKNKDGEEITVNTIYEYRPSAEQKGVDNSPVADIEVPDLDEAFTDDVPY